MSSEGIPPEWAPQQATLMVWPRQAGDWGNGLTEARRTMAELVRVVGEYQPVILAVDDAEARQSAAAFIGSDAVVPSRLRIVDAANDDIWARDTGPITRFEQGMRHFLDFRFDGWGGQFDAGNDDRLTATLYAAGVFGPGRHVRHDFTLEGGSIEVNGDGALLTTERCLVRGRRNAGIDGPRIRTVLGDTLGVDRVHWLTRGHLLGDDTDGHIDTLARFVAADTIVYQGCDDRDDPHHDELAAMAAELTALRDRHDLPYRCIALPLPRAVHDPDDDHRLPAGYANFLIVNGAVIMPLFDDPADCLAADTLTALFPDRDIRGVDSRALIRQHGSLHCAAMQIPAEPVDA